MQNFKFHHHLKYAISLLMVLILHGISIVVMPQQMSDNLEVLLPDSLRLTDSLQFDTIREARSEANSINAVDSLPLFPDGLNAENDSTHTEPDSSETGKDVGRLSELSQAPDVGSILSFGKVFWSLIFILLGYFIIKLLSGILSVISERNVRSKPMIRRILPIIKIVGWSLVVYIIINGIFQPPQATVFAFFASVGVAIGFASQDLLKNIFGGLMILFDKPFQIGDKIEAGKYYGEVLEIGLRSTRIVTSDDSIITIPNSDMMSQSISNSNSGDNNCQVVAEFYFPVVADTRRIRQIATEAAQVSRYVYLNKPIAVEFSNIIMPRGSFLKMRLKAYVNDVRYEYSFQSEMTEIVLRETAKEGMLEGL
jgi:MscS family membrane protein